MRLLAEPFARRGWPAAGLLPAGLTVTTVFLTDLVRVRLAVSAIALALAIPMSLAVAAPTLLLFLQVNCHQILLWYYHMLRYVA